MTIAETTFVVIDTETTGLDYAGGDRVVEIAARQAGHPYREWETLVNPGRPVPITASAVHHLTDRDVAHSPRIEVAEQGLARFLGALGPSVTLVPPLRPSNVVLVAHNAEFDRSFLPTLDGYRWLCTKRLAQHLCPDAPAHNNQVLRYYFGGQDLDLRGIPPHRAMADVIVTEFNLEQLLERWVGEAGPVGVYDVEGLIAYAESPILITTMPFGKYRGLPLSELDNGYIRWLQREIKDDPDLQYSLVHELTRRQSLVAP